MKREMIEFIRENGLTAFNESKIRASSLGIFKTGDARAVYNKVIGKLSRNFKLKDTENLWNFFDANSGEIAKRQEFFKNLKLIDNNFLEQLEKPRAVWKPRYQVVVVTENEETFTELQKLDCPIKFLVNEMDLQELEGYDIVQIIDCENFSLALENLPQSVFLDNSDEVYLERYLELLSGWKKNIEIIGRNELNDEIKNLINEISPLLKLVEEKTTDKISREGVDRKLEEMNENIFRELKGLSISGEKLIEVLNKNLPKELEELVSWEIKNSGLPEQVFVSGIPIEKDEQEIERFIKLQESGEHTSLAEAIKKNSEKLKEIPRKLKELEEELLFFDFCSGNVKFMKEQDSWPETSESFIFSNSKNIFLEKPEPISFSLENVKCSMLTGANSGGKTTLLEHVLQLISLFYLGLPVSGMAKIPEFSEVYYFAKNKGSMSRGAFETLLEQMAEIKTGKQTLILADEMEAVTEPGVAGNIINATAEYFLNRGCFLIMATHLGQEIKKSLPNNARIDGIEAKGLDENFELIIDRNPILGKLASSTPELIVEKLANIRKDDYFLFLHNYLKKI